MSARQTPDITLVETLGAMSAAGGNQVHAAEALGISRSTLRDRLGQAKRRGLELTSTAEIASPSDKALQHEVQSLRSQLRTAQADQSIQAWAQAIVLGADDVARSRGPAPWLAEARHTPTLPASRRCC